VDHLPLIASIDCKIILGGVKLDTNTYKRNEPPKGLEPLTGRLRNVCSAV
jgi:hypothetical protein